MPAVVVRLEVAHTVEAKTVILRDDPPGLSVHVCNSPQSARRRSNAPVKFSDTAAGSSLSARHSGDAVGRSASGTASINQALLSEITQIDLKGSDQQPFGLWVRFPRIDPASRSPLCSGLRIPVQEHGGYFRGRSSLPFPLGNAGRSLPAPPAPHGVQEATRWTNIHAEADDQRAGSPPEERQLVNQASIMPA